MSLEELNAGSRASAAEPWSREQELRWCARDVVALSSLPAVWNGWDPGQIVKSLAESLARALLAEFVYVRLNGPPTIERAHAVGRPEIASQAKEISTALGPWLNTDGPLSIPSFPNPVGPGSVRICITPIGNHGERGLIATGSKKPDFPDGLDSLLLNVGANQAAIAFSGVPHLAEAKRAPEERGGLLACAQAARAKAERANPPKDESLTNPSYSPPELIGHSPCMRELFELIARASQSSFPVLITGETGTGKELVARAIHESSPQRHRPFLPVDCAAFVPTLIETELFGYVRGAFTGATCSHAGLLASAQSGTVFLDEIGEMPVELQAKLLRALQEREFRPVGSTHQVEFHARIIAATNRNLEEAVEQGRFRQDLYFRLSVITIQIPPLRARKEDIPFLANSFLDKFCGQGHPRPVLGEDALECLMAYDWPGNVRELENCIQRTVVLGAEEIIRSEDLALPSRNHRKELQESDCGQHLLSLQELERQAIIQALAAADGNKHLAAKALGIGVSTIYRKLREYSISSSNCLGEAV